MREWPWVCERKRIAARLAVVAAVALGAVAARADDAVCARVKLEIQQKLVITRTAFRATLELNNGTDADFLEDIQVTLDIRDTDGNPANDRFNYQTLDVTGIQGGVGGQGILAPASTGTAAWTLIPYHEAAPAEATEYDIGAELRYVMGDELFVIPMFPERITVLPDPILHVKYFWQRDVFSDDPFTDDVVEPAVPFSLGLMIHNSGAGAAHNMRITSSQPKIVDNKRGLLINFQLVGTQVGTQAISPSLTVNFGDVGPGATAIAQFLMTSSLQGHFIEYSASFEHVTGLGDPRLSLIDSLEIRELIHAVRATVPADDQLPDFLCNVHTWYDFPPQPWEDPRDPRENHTNPDRSDLPDTLYLSDGTTAFVTPLLDGISVTTEGTNASIEAPMPGGWAYLKFPDPFNGQYALVSVERTTDGSPLIMGYNAWQTDRLFVDRAPAITAYRIHLFDHSGDGKYTLHFSPDTLAPSAVKWQIVAAHGAGLGTDLPLDIGTDGKFSEPRAGGIKKLLVYFSEPIRSESFNLPNVRGLAADNTEIDLSGVTITTSLAEGRTRGEIAFSPPLPDFGSYCIKLIGVKDMAGNDLAAGANIVIAGLLGDATGDRRVNNTDVGAVSSLVGTNPIDPTNARHIRADVNLDGKIDSADVDLVLAARGKDARSIPPPCLRDDGGGTGLRAGPFQAGGRMGLSAGADLRDSIPEPSVYGPGEVP